MLKAEFFEIVANGENSGVEFKRDDTNFRNPLSGFYLRWIFSK